MILKRLLIFPLLVACAADAAPAGTAHGCRILKPSTPLPTTLGESSGVAASRAWPETLWTHNDSGGDAAVFAVRSSGELVGRVAVPGARNRDWEDLALGPCPGGSCLYLADTGNNSGKRKDLVIYRVAEPRPDADATARAERLPVRYPEGRHDAEALFVLPTGEIFLVTKGRHSAVSLYRYPGEPRVGEEVVLERVAELSAGEQEHPHLVTGASASPSGEWVAIRSYQWLNIYRTRELVAGNTRPATVMDLSPVGEAQGEAVELLDDGRVVLTSEGGFKEAPGTFAVLACELPA